MKSRSSKAPSSNLPFTDWAASFHWDEMHSKNASVVGQKWKIQDDNYSEEN